MGNGKTQCEGEETGRDQKDYKTQTSFGMRSKHHRIILFPGTAPSYTRARRLPPISELVEADIDGHNCLKPTSAVKHAVSVPTKTQGRGLPQAARRAAPEGAGNGASPKWAVTGERRSGLGPLRGRVAPPSCRSSTLEACPCRVTVACRLHFLIEIIQLLDDGYWPMTFAPAASSPQGKSSRPFHLWRKIIVDRLISRLQCGASRVGFYASSSSQSAPPLAFRRQLESSPVKIWESPLSSPANSVRS